MPQRDLNFKDRVKDRLGSDLVNMVIASGVSLRRAGSSTWKGLCPFHNEKTPSFVVCNGEMGWHFKCHGCGAVGDCFSYFMRKDGLEFVDAVEYVANYLGMELPTVSPEQQKLDERLNRLRAVVSRTTTWFQQRLYLDEAKPVRDYLTERGITEQNVRDFLIGYSPPFLPNPRRGENRQWQDFHADLTSQFGFGREELVASGVFREDRNGSLAPFFAGRLMFPLCDGRGRPVAFSGRTMDGEAGHKYVNTGDTPLFRKGNTVYNEYRARKQVDSGRPVLVVEGYTDVIAAENAGLGPVVSCMGTAVTQAQVELIWRIGQRNTVNAPIFCLDGDAAGRRAAVSASRLMLPLIRANRYARVALLSATHDPASMLGEPGGAERFQAVLDDAVPVPIVLWDEEVRAHQPLATPECRSAFKLAVDDNITKRMTDPDLTREYRRDFFQRFADLTVRPPAFVARRSFRGDVPQMPDRCGPAAVLATLLTHPPLFDEFAEDLALENFGDLEMMKSNLLHWMSRAEDDQDARRIASGLIDKPDVQETLFPPMMVDTAPFTSPVCSDADARIAVAGILRHMRTEGIRSKVNALMQDGSPADQDKLRQIAALLASLGGDPP